MASYSVLLDACVLYPQTLRDLLLTLAATGLFHAHPDNFLASMIKVGGDLACEAIKAMRERYKKPPMSATNYIASINAKGLVKTASLLATMTDQI